MRCSVAFGITLRLLVINISSSSLAKHCTLNYYQRCVTSSLTTWPNSEFRLLAMTSRRQLLCFWQSHASVSRGSYVGNACERLPASVDPPAEVSTSPNHTTKWTVYKSGIGEVLSAIEAGSVARRSKFSNLYKMVHGDINSWETNFLCWKWNSWASFGT